MLKDKSDSELLFLYSENQDKECIGELFFRHSDIAYRTALAQLKNTSDAEDIVQIAFIEVFKSYQNFHHGSFVAWLLKIVIHRSIDRIRSNARRKKREAKIETNLYYEDKMTDHHQEKIIMDHLEKLPDHYKQPIHLKVLENLSIKEIAEILSLPDKTIHTQITRGLEKLRRSLSAAGVKISTIILTGALTSIKLKAAPATFKSETTLKQIIETISQQKKTIPSAHKENLSLFSTIAKSFLVVALLTSATFFIYKNISKNRIEEARLQNAKLKNDFYDFEQPKETHIFKVIGGKIEIQNNDITLNSNALYCEDLTMLELDISKYKLPIKISYDCEALYDAKTYALPAHIYYSEKDNPLIINYIGFKDVKRYAPSAGNKRKMSSFNNNKWGQLSVIFRQNEIITFDNKILSNIHYINTSNKIRIVVTNATYIDNFLIEEIEGKDYLYGANDIIQTVKNYHDAKKDTLINEQSGRLKRPFKKLNKDITLTVYKQSTFLKYTQIKQHIHHMSD